VSAFIQDGQTTCKVALTLCNSPKDEAFAYNQYGKTITVERTIRRQGASSYRLLNWKKEVVSRTADEVTRLKDHYFVQVDNPCSVLGQDDAKALTDGTDEFKYKFYLRASGLQMVLDQLCYCTDARRQLEDILNRQTRDLQEKKTELEACEREYEAAQDRIKLRESLEALDKELAWCLVRDERDKVRQYRDELEDLLAKADDDSVDIRRLQLKIDAKEEERNSRMDIVASFNERQEEYRRRHVKLREALTDAKKRRKSKEKEVASDRSAVRERANDQEESENRIRQLAAVSKASDTANEDKALNKVKTDLAGACADVARGQERLEQLEGAIEEVEDAIEKERHEKEHHHNAMEDLGKAKQAAQSCLDSFNVHSNNPDVRFGNDLVRLLAEIDRRASEFTLKPVLVGRYITLKEQRWETAVQSAIGVGNLKTLICTEYRDEELCVKIINELNLRRSCVNFHRMHFDGHSYRDTGKLKLHLFPASNKGFITVLDMITTTRTLVENFLYDKQVYTQLLCEDRDTCMKIVFREQPERNVRKCYQLDGTCYYVQSASQHQVPYQARTNLLSLDNHAAILKAQRDLSDVETRTEDEKKRFVAVLNGFLQEGRTPEQRHADLRAERTRLEVNQGRAGRRMTDLKQQLADIQMETDDGTLAAREDEIRLLQSHSQDMSQEIDRLSTQIETSEQQLDELTQAEKENDEELKRHQRDQMQDETLHEGTNTELTELERDIAKLTHRKRKHEQNKNAIRESARVAQQRKEEAEKAVGTETTKAKRFCEQEEEVVSTATSEELENKKQRIEIRLAVEQRRSGGRSISDIEDALDRATHRNEQATTHMKNVLSTQERVRQGFSARHKKYRQFRQSTELNARKMFHKHMGNRTHAAGGDLRFDHKRRTLQIIAQIGRRSVTNSKTLSGGEKSFTTMSLLMGLGAVTQVPFGIFDEVDVYMDPATREISLQKLAEMARMKKGQRQFLVLTPNEAEVRQNIQEDEGCKIIVMQAPRRFSAGE
jgi:chromosome segregation ATPase